MPTDACRRWVGARIGNPHDADFRWNYFARSAVAAFSEAADSMPAAAESVIAGYLWRAYSRVARPIGHTPFDSLALLGMLLAASDGRVIEMSDFLRLMLKIKKHSALPQHAFFAAGNEIDTMFVQLKPGFVDAVNSIANDLRIREA
jgi:hypothetical protein